MKKILVAALVLSLGLVTAPSFASHAWSNYHWARTSSSFDLTVVNSTTSDWDGYVSDAISDWSSSNKVNFVEDPNGSTSSKDRRQCRAPEGQVRICNLEYGNTGWLGIAGISIDSNGHISSGYTKLNDTYFSTAYYNNSLWKQSVTCQELGHNVGLGHQDEDFNNSPLFTCMDYQDPPFASPNSHDYSQLQTIYNHTDSYNSYITGGGGGGGCNSPPGKGCNKAAGGGTNGNNGEIGWGMSLGRRGDLETFIRIDPDGTQHITHVLWTVEDAGDGHDH